MASRLCWVRGGCRRHFVRRAAPGWCVSGERGARAPFPSPAGRLAAAALGDAADFSVGSVQTKNARDGIVGGRTLAETAAPGSAAGPPRWGQSGAARPEEEGGRNYAAGQQ